MTSTAAVHTQTASRKRSIPVIHARTARGPFLLDDVNVRPGDSYRPGTPGSEELLPEGLDLVVRQAGTTMLTLTEAMSGVAVRGEVSYDIHDLIEAGHAMPAGRGVWRLTLTPGDKLRLAVADYRVNLDYTGVEPLPMRPLGEDVLRGNLGLLIIGSILAHLLVLMTAFMMPVTGHTLEMDDLRMRSRFVPVQSNPDVIVTNVERETNDTPEAPDAAEGNTKEQVVADARPRRRSRPDMPRKTLKAEDAGVLGAIAQQRGALFFGEGAANADRLTAGMLYGKTAPGDSGHALLDGTLDALRRSGPSRRGIALSDGAIGDEIRKTGVRRRTPELLEERKTKVPAKVVAGDPRVTGGPGKAAIRRTIKNNRARFRYCYEQGLKRNPSLAGRVVLSFTINNDGRVIASRKVGSTLGDAKVETCVARKMSGVRFPSFPAGIARVTYPFQFVGGR